MQKNLIIIDVQRHFLKEKIEKYSKKINFYLKEESEKINEVYIVYDIQHQDLNYEDLDLNNEDNQIEELFQYNMENPETEEQNNILFYEKLLPIELIKQINKLQENGIKINYIPKEYGDLQVIIDYHLEKLPYLLNILIESKKYNINELDFEMDFDNTIEIINKNHKTLKKIIQEIYKKFDIDKYELQELFENIRYYFEEEIEKYEKLLSLNNKIEIFGGGTMECVTEEVTSIITIAKHLNIDIKNKLKINTSLLYGDYIPTNVEFLKIDYISKTPKHIEIFKKYIDFFTKKIGNNSQKTKSRKKLKNKII